MSGRRQNRFELSSRNDKGKAKAVGKKVRQICATLKGDDLAMTLRNWLAWESIGGAKVTG